MARRPHRKREESERPFRRLILWILGAIIVTVGGPYIVQWFVTILPGPRPTASVVGIRGHRERTGCVWYTFELRTADGPTEYVYAKLQFPDQINDHKVGLARETEVAGTGRVQIATLVARKNAQGECTVVDTAGVKHVDVQASAEGHMIAIHASKLAPKTMIVGLIATTEGRSVTNPPPKFYTEGAYEYAKLGQTVRRPLHVRYDGVREEATQSPDARKR